MKIIIPSVIVALSLALASTSLAKVYTPAQFKAALKLKIGNRQGATAFNAAAALYRTALTDTKNKKYAVVYTSAVVSALNKPVKPPLRGKSVNALTKALLFGYFAHRSFNLNDGLYNRSFDRLLSSLPASQKTGAVSQAIYNTLKSFALKKGSTQLQVYQYYLTKSDRYHIQDPPTS
jgi:hypothetical protein